MDNQHKLIKGYRDLSQEEIDLMNEVKVKAVEVGDLVNKLTDLLNKQCDAILDNDEVGAEYFFSSDPFNWLQRGKNDLQDGFMKLVRSIAKPTTF